MAVKLGPLELLLLSYLIYPPGPLGGRRVSVTKVVWFKRGIRPLRTVPGSTAVLVSERATVTGGGVEPGGVTSDATPAVGARSLKRAGGLA